MIETTERASADGEGEGRELVRMVAMVPADLLAGLTREAERLGVSVASLVRETLAARMGYMLPVGSVGKRAGVAWSPERTAARVAGAREYRAFKRAARERR